MSYDLYFAARGGRSAISEEEFISYFERRGHYQSDTQACYENEDTGVHFWFNYGAEESDEFRGLAMDMIRDVEFFSSGN